MNWTKTPYPEYLQCPFCGSGDFEFTEEKTFSLGKAAKGAFGGGLAAGPLAPFGAIAGGIFGGRGKRALYRCLNPNCRQTWEKEL